MLAFLAVGSQDLDGEHTRHKILMADGMLFNFSTGELRKARMSDRMTRRAAATSEEWSSAPAAVTIGQKIYHFFASGGKSLYNVADAELGAVATEIKDSLQQLMDETPNSALKVLLDFSGDWDCVVWFLRLASRAASAHPKFCQFVYMHGAGRSGKDVAVSLLFNFFGGDEGGYAVLLPGTFVAKSSAGGSREGPAPFLASLFGCRLYWISEVPEHEDFNMALMKPLCEQQGAPMTARALYRAPVACRPSGLAICTSNFPMKLKSIDDDGAPRRTLHMDTRFKFVYKPSELTHRKAR